MTNEVTTVQNSQVVQITENINYLQNAQKYLSTCGQNVPQNKVQEFLEIAQLKQLNPFTREIYLVGYGQNFNIITGYEVYLKRAEKMPFYDGFDFVIDDSNPQRVSGTITIYRKDRSHNFKHTVYLNEVINKNKDGNPNAMWAKMPYFMLKKVAIAQGFRLCFPLDFADMPYIKDEMPEGESFQPTMQSPVINQEVHEVKQPTTQENKTVENPKENVLVKEYSEQEQIKIEMGQVMKSVYPNGEPVFTQTDKDHYTELYKKDRKSALTSAKMLLNDRMTGFHEMQNVVY